MAILNIQKDGCTCHARATTQGCSEWSCLYHGRENERKTRELRDSCPVHPKEK